MHDNTAERVVGPHFGVQAVYQREYSGGPLAS